ncbi:MAG: hypothetical protein QOK15_1346 [Nocardioidaceae bacterium]|jgi:hypothetical protein|nr:hypothetical protein [Nocardioidaceae bacterium]
MSRLTRAVLTLLIGAGGCALVVAPSAGASASTHRPAVRSTPAVLAAATTHLHFIVNLDGSVAPRRLGYNVFDTGDSPSEIRALPQGVKALVWLGQKCPTAADADFRATVRQLSGMRRVVGYYLADEPHISDCPGGPAGLATRTSFIHKVSDGRQKAFAILSEDEDFRPFRPAVTGLDLVGLDPYPCSDAHPDCDLSKIGREVTAAHERRIPLRKMVPVYQAFGQEHASDGYYHLPTPDQLRRMLNRWAEVLPSPPMDYTYSWGHQSSADPTLVDAPGLQTVLSDFFAG